MYETAVMEAVEKTLNDRWDWLLKNHPDWLYEKNGEKWMNVPLDVFNKGFKYVKKDSNGLDMETLSDYITEMKDQGLLVAKLVKSNWWVSLVSQNSAPAQKEEVSSVSSYEEKPVTNTKKRTWAETSKMLKLFFLNTNAEWWWGLKANEDGSKSLWDGSRTFKNIAQYNLYRKYSECDAQVSQMTKKAISAQGINFVYTDGLTISQEEWQLYMQKGCPNPF